jgi:hypothetical protein
MDHARWILPTLAATVLALVYLTDGILDRLSGTPLLVDAYWHALLVLNGLSIALALLNGQRQLVPRWRRRWPQVRVWLDRLYAVSAMVSALITIALARKIDAGPVTAMALLIAGWAWLMATMLGKTQTWRLDIGTHQRWVARSLVLTAAAVSLCSCIMFNLPLAVACPACVLALLSAELWLRDTRDVVIRQQRHSRIPSAARAINLGVKITIETLDGWDFSKANVPHE